MCLPRLLLLLCVLWPALVRAQAPQSSPPPPPAPATLSPPPLLPAPGEPEASEEPTVPHPEKEEAREPRGELIPRRRAALEHPGFSVSRFMVEVLGGIGGGLIGGFGGALLGVGISSGDNCSAGDFGCGYAAAFLTVPVGIAVGLSTGVYLVGKALGGKGSIGPTVLGMLAGTAAGGLIALSGAAYIPPVVALSVFPVLGAVAGYEFSHALWEPPRTFPRTYAGANSTVVPLVAVTPRGGLIGGLAGHF